MLVQVSQTTSCHGAKQALLSLITGCQDCSKLIFAPKTAEELSNCVAF